MKQGTLSFSSKSAKTSIQKDNGPKQTSISTLFSNTVKQTESKSTESKAQPVLEDKESLQNIQKSADEVIITKKRNFDQLEKSQSPMREKSVSPMRNSSKPSAEAEESNISSVRSSRANKRLKRNVDIEEEQAKLENKNPQYQEEEKKSPIQKVITAKTQQSQLKSTSASSFEIRPAATKETAEDAKAAQLRQEQQKSQVSTAPHRSADKIRKPSDQHFCPIKDAPHNNGQAMPFSFISRALAEIEECSGKNSQTVVKEIICNVFRAALAVNQSELVNLFYFFIVKLAPEYEAIETGIGHELLSKSVAKACGKSLKQIRDAFKEEGDLGIVVALGKKTQKNIGTFFKAPTATKKADITFNEVFNAFLEIGHTSGNNSVMTKENIITRILQHADNLDAKYIVRWLQKALKTGAAEKTVISALARAIAYTPPNKATMNQKKQLGEVVFTELVVQLEYHIKEASCEFPNYGEIIERLLEIGDQYEKIKETCYMKVGIPLKPMLAKPTKGIQIIFKRFENISFTCEYKYDGFRGQVHFWKDKETQEPKVTIYSRNLENMTVAYPDVVEFLIAYVEDNCSHVSDFILDAELIAYDVKADKILPFQVLTQRSRKNVKKEDLDTNVCICAFDILFLNGESLLKKNFIERRCVMHDMFTVKQGQFIFAKYQDAQSFEEIEAFLHESIKDCCEGLMVKTLDVNATYEPSKRSFNWLKLKKDYLDTELGDSVDLVVVGADYGKGKRTGFYGSYLLACYHEDLECLQTVCKVGSGFTDEMQEKIHKELKELEIDHAPSNLKYKEKNIDVWLQPTYVWEIKAADLSISPVYVAALGEIEPERGIALRFPRFIRERGDKRVDEATNNEQLLELYKAQAAVNIDFGANDDFDF